MIKVTLGLPRTIRVKLNTQCQFKCKFCHQEGDKNTKDIESDNLVARIMQIRDLLGFNRVHFTGGEPTLYKNFSILLKELKRNNFINALTTNGQFKVQKIKELRSAGLESINFSLHYLKSGKFLQNQDVDYKRLNGYKWAKNCVQTTKNNILATNKIIPTKVNCVIGRDYRASLQVLNFCIKNKIKLRLLDDLSLKEEAAKSIRKILSRKKAILVGHEITHLSSSHRLDYRINNYDFGIKGIRRFFLESMCDGCKLKNNGKCLEGFYGIRLENNPLKVRLCLNRDGDPYVQKFDDFLKSKQLKEMIKIKRNAYLYK